MPIVRLALLSVLNRRVTAGLTLLAIALSVAMLLGVEKVRRDARGAFANTISGTDLIVGARSGAIQLLLYSVFRIGNATSNISWESYRDVAGLPRVRWTVADLARRFAPRLSGDGDQPRILRALPVCPHRIARVRHRRTVRRRLRRGARGGSRRTTRVRARRRAHRLPRSRRRELRRSRRQAVPRGRDPRPHRNSGRSHRARQRGRLHRDARGLGGRRTDTGV